MLLRSARISSWALLTVAALIWGLVGCSSNSPSTTARSTTTTASAGCADAAALKSSLDALRKVNVQQDGVNALTIALADVKTKLGAAAASASSALQPKVQHVQTAVDALETATNGLTTSNLTQKAPAIAAALTQVTLAMSALSTALAQGCPGS